MQRKKVRGRSFCGEKGFCLQVLVPLSSRYWVGSSRLLLALLVKKKKKSKKSRKTQKRRRLKRRLRRVERVRSFISS